MKKLFALLMVLVMMLSVALAETAADVDVSELESMYAMNMEDLLPQVGLTVEDGEYLQLGESEYKVWVPKDTFTVQEIPQEADYEEVVLLLSYNADPDKQVKVELTEGELDFATAYAEVKNQILKNGEASAVTQLSPSIVNGINAFSYYVAEADGTSNSVAAYFVDNNQIIFVSFPNVQADDPNFYMAAAIVGISVQK